MEQPRASFHLVLETLWRDLTQSPLFVVVRAFLPPPFLSLFKGEAKLYLEKEKDTTQLQALSETLQGKTEQKAPALGERGR